MFEKFLKFPRERIYRIGVSFAIFFIVINICVYAFLPSYKQIGRASEYFFDLNICNFSDKDLNEIIQLLKNDKKPKIILLGDSVGYGIGVEENESISGRLRSLQNDYSVYNLSVCGSKPLDYYLWMRFFSKIDSDRKNIYLIQYNYKWFGLSAGKLENIISQKKILIYFQVYLTDEIKNDTGFNPGWFDTFKFLVDRNIPVVSNKTTLFALLFRERSKEDLMRHIFFGGGEKPSFEEKRKSFNCRIDYSSGEWNEEDFNYKIYLETLDLINQKQLNAFVLMPPYNEQITGRCQDAVFKNNVDKFLSDAALKNVSAAEFVNDVPAGFFLDDMHLTEDGSAVFAEKLLSKIKQ